MGIENECFVHPERISSELICPICTLVLENPVQTPSEHLFCEDELLEWLTRSETCPVTKTKLNPDCISPPGRVILNMLGNLERWCPNKLHGCTWTGQNSSVSGHTKVCTFKSREDLFAEIVKKDSIIEKLKRDMSKMKNKLVTKEETCLALESRLEYVERKLKVYDAFFKDEKESCRPPRPNVDTYENDLRRLTRLKQLDSLNSTAEFK